MINYFRRCVFLPRFTWDGPSVWPALSSRSLWRHRFPFRPLGAVMPLPPSWPVSRLGGAVMLARGVRRVSGWSAESSSSGISDNGVTALSPRAGTPIISSILPIRYTTYAIRLSVPHRPRLASPRARPVAPRLQIDASRLASLLWRENQLGRSASGRLQ